MSETLERRDGAIGLKPYRVEICGRFKRTFFVEAEDWRDARRTARALFENGAEPDRSRDTATFFGTYPANEEGGAER